MSNSTQVSIKILNKEFKINCPLEAEQRLVNAADVLNRKMRECRANHGIVGSEKIAVITALNVIDEMIDLQNKRNINLNSVNEKLVNLSDRLDKILSTPIAKPRIRSYPVNSFKSNNFEKTIDEEEIII